ncbi:MAG: DNA repair exonuclease [Candidatus Aenigmarchaeota archaeon]|nr:DNA repair exonuclease [Candidatus Aenigmarchaeota archaeon]MDW8159829.1 DNA repair exonuclease [Candidatus Aenigmarchaeota archaeon]
MIISVISDCHLGFSPEIRLEEDSYKNFEEAFNKALDSDLIILCGDLFDSRAPKTKAWAYALKVLSKVSLESDRGVRLVETNKKLKENSIKTISHLPVIAIHGNHEVRVKGEINAIEALENAGFLVHLDKHYITFEKNGEFVTIHGMSHVAERLAKDVLYKWSPIPKQNSFNILLLHQNIHPFVYSPLDEPSINVSNLPSNFDIIVDGHIHVHTVEKIGNSLLVFPGSTVITQFQPSEAEIQKGFVKIDTSSKKVEFVPISQRKFFYEVLELKGLNGREILERRVREIIFNNLQPIIKFRINGEISEKELREIEKKYWDLAILMFARSLESSELASKIEFIRNVRDQKLSLDELGVNLLKKTLDELGFKGSFDFFDVFNLLKEEEIDLALKILTGEQSTLRMMK